MKAIGLARKLGLSAIGVFATVMLAACQSGPPQISISGAKAELSPAVVGEAMVSMSIRNDGGSDLLGGVKADIPGAKVSLHVMQGERMVHADTIDVPAKNKLIFAMGGSHVMIENMPKTMKKGSKFNLTLVFEKSGEMTMSLMLEVAPMMPMDHDHM